MAMNTHLWTTESKNQKNKQNRHRLIDTENILTGSLGGWLKRWRNSEVKIGNDRIVMEI